MRNEYKASTVVSQEVLSKYINLRKFRKRMYSNGVSAKVTEDESFAFTKKFGQDVKYM